MLEKLIGAQTSTSSTKQHEASEVSNASHINSAANMNYASLTLRIKAMLNEMSTSCKIEVPEKIQVEYNRVRNYKLPPNITYSIFLDFSPWNSFCEI